MTLLKKCAIIAITKGESLLKFTFKGIKMFKDIDRARLLNELQDEATKIINAISALQGIMGVALDCGLKARFVNDITDIANEINSAYVHIVSDGRLQNAGYFEMTWRCQYNRIIDYVQILRVWLEMLRELNLGLNDSILSDTMLEFIDRHASVASSEARSLYNFCERELNKIRAGVCDDNSSETL